MALLKMEPGQAKMIKKGALILGLGVLLLALLAVFRAGPAAQPGEEAGVAVDLDSAEMRAAAQTLSKAIRIQTISWGDERDAVAGAPDGPFAELHALLETAYPRVHEALERRVINGASLIYRWPGVDADAPPAALSGHLDVVPIEGGTEGAWTAPPFSGRIEDGVIWGRGALDDKGAVVAILAAAENLLERGFRPSRDIYFLFGHDEEIGGHNGAGAIIEHLREKGVRLAWTIDEGSAPVRNVLPGFDGTLALIALAEKGSTTLKLTTTAAGGHSSTPSQEMAAVVLAEALAKVGNNPYPYQIDENITAFLHAIAPHTPFSQRLALKNLWLLGGVVKGELSKDPVTAASLHTTTAVTIVSAGTKTNILPQKAEAFINYRIHPRDTPEGVKARAIRLIDDERVTVTVHAANPPSAVSSREAEGYRLIAQTIKETFGDIVIAPSLTLQATDQVHYAQIADDAYRFFPFVLEPEDLNRIHGTNERITVENFARGIAFYERFIEAAGTDE